MCLYIDNVSIAKTKKIKSINAGKTVIRYKALRFDSDTGGYISPIMDTPVTPILKSNRRSAELTYTENSNKFIDRGIHVYRKSYDANKAFGYDSTCKIFEVECNIDDLVCCDIYNKEEVYTKIYIPKLDRKVKKEKTGEKNMVKWNDVFILKFNQDAVLSFVNNELSRDEFLSVMKGIPGIRNLVRSRGVREARNIARKALRRRGIEV